MDIKKFFGQRLKNLRKQKGWTQEETELQTAVAYRSLQDLEAGRTFPSLLTIFKLCKGFGLSPATLLDPVWAEWIKTQKKS